MAYMYILECADGSYYVGSTRNIDKRLDEHQRGLGAVYTRKRRPVTLVFTHEFATIQEAWGMERRVHGWSRAKRKALIDGDFDSLPGLARGRNRGQLDS